MATNSPVLTPLHPRLRGSTEKSITVPSEAGSGVNEVLDKCVRGRKDSLHRQLGPARFLSEAMEGAEEEEKRRRREPLRFKQGAGRGKQGGGNECRGCQKKAGWD
ncbi:unnamed protein product [Pleuronectes platessa]|uniref:Uncharacterized protein n=1 Tax=Pleuronectes platessa TaxID=8262 RepID=A0A9N7URM7_PLEPL|nr:unnamed protein product [Pleuronectes platessa]